MPTYPTQFFSSPFAEDGDKTIIGAEPVATGRASLPLGFPPVTATPVAQGGVAPQREDFNGILYMLSAFAFWQQSGGMWQYNSDLDYTPPAIAFYSGKYWQCVQASSADAPVTPGTNDAYWRDLSDFLGTLKSLTLTGDATGTGKVSNGTMTINVNVNQADKLADPMTLTFSGQATGSVTFDGSENATVSLNIQGFLPTTGGTITGPITWNGKPLINSVNGVAADSSGNVQVPAFTQAVTLNGTRSVTVPEGGMWAVVYFDWGSDWGIPYVATVPGGTVLQGHYNRIAALCIRVS